MRLLAAMLVGIPMLLSAVAGEAMPGDRLYIQVSCVNIRSGPTIESKVLMQGEQGRPLFEFDRQKGWIQVGIEGTDGKIGWIARQFVGPDRPTEKGSCR